MSIVENVSSPDLISQIRALDGMSKIAETEFKKAMQHVVPITLSAWVAAAPQGVTGRTRRDVSCKISGHGYKITGKVGYLSKTAVWYPNVVNYGRFAGRKMPPPSALISWIETRLGMTTEEAEHAAFMISRSIARKGSRPGKQFVQEAMKVAQPAVNVAFAAAGEEIVQKLAIHAASEVVKSSGGGK